MSPTLVLALCFVITLAIGVPVVWSLALSSMVACLSIPGISLSFLAQKMELGSEQYSLLAIFFFMLAGAVMQHGGIAVRLIAFAKTLTGSLRGGLSIVTIVACMFFAALSGSSVATTAAIGAIMYPELVKDGYEKGYAAALPVVGGTLGIVIPPSIVFVVYGTADVRNRARRTGGRCHVHLLLFLCGAPGDEGQPAFQRQRIPRGNEGRFLGAADAADRLGRNLRRCLHANGIRGGGLHLRPVCLLRHLPGAADAEADSDRH